MENFKNFTPAVLGAASVGALVYALQKYGTTKKKEFDPVNDVTTEEIQEEFKKVQNHICEFLEKTCDQKFFEDKWDYNKGTGGGISRVWEGSFADFENYSDPDFWKKENIVEKGGVNFSGISGNSLPPSAATQLKVPHGTPFRATGVSLVIHPKNPNIPTIHMNIR
jgi:coproporphyrinogen III oxidase